MAAQRVGVGRGGCGTAAVIPNDDPLDYAPAHSPHIRLTSLSLVAISIALVSVPIPHLGTVNESCNDSCV